MPMRKILLLAVLGACASPALGANLSVTVNVGDPRYYGAIDTYGYPAPEVIYREPVIIQRREVVRQPVYVRVPPGHAKHWEKHCRRYNACDRPVYFIRDDWYRNVYVPRYVEVHGKGHHEKHPKHEKHGKGHKDDD